MIHAAAIADALGRLAGVAHRTPVVTSRTLDGLTGSRIYLKCENLQRAGAFKFRGAYYTLSRLADPSRGVVTFSSGNHAQATALAGSLLGIPTTIFMPDDAPATKLEATTGYGATVRRYDRLREDRAALAATFSADTGATLVPPYDHPDIIAGQGTAAAELIEQIPDLDRIVVPVGGGGLIAGSAIAACASGVAVSGVEPALANDTALSLAAGSRVTIDPPPTIADGLRSTVPGELTFPIVQQLVDDILTVSEDEIRSAVRFAVGRLKLVIEPSGAVGLAAALAGRLPQGQRIGIIISGGNIDPDTLATILLG